MKQHLLLLFLLAALKLWHCDIYQLVVCPLLNNSLRRPAAGPLGEECCLILVWYCIRPSMLNSLRTSFLHFALSWCAKCFQLVKGADCRQASSASGFVVCKSMHSVFFTHCKRFLELGLNHAWDFLYFPMLFILL